MKKSIYLPYLILCVLLFVPVTACTTKTAAEKLQEPPYRQEQTATDTRTGDALPQSAAAETTSLSNADSRQDVPRENLPHNSHETAAKPDAISGATIDTVSGATVSRQQKPETTHSDTETAAQNIERNSDESTLHQESIVAAPLEAVPDNPVTVAETATAVCSESAVSGTASDDTGSVVTDTIPDKSVLTDSTVEQAPIDVNTKTAPSAPVSEPGIASAAADEPVQPEATAEDTPDTPAPLAEQNEPAYETMLTDLITDFEQQGGTHGYEPPPTFHEEMLDLFSPQIFTVALSKEPETQQKPKVSRMVAVEEKQRLELTYPGHGWVYVGEQTSQPGLKYEQRKLQDNDSIFMFTAEKKGDYVLHFSYFDVFTNEFVTDAVAVSVSAARSTAAKSMVKAPEYQNKADSDTAEAASEAPQAAVSGLQNKTPEPAMTAERTGTVSATTGNTSSSTGQVPAARSEEEPLNSDQLLEKARTAIAAADAGTALTYLDNFFTTAAEKLDEGWFLKGRAYELNGSVRNIRLALNAYRMLTDSFPQSKYWAEADARIRYITGFYINIQ